MDLDKDLDKNKNKVMGSDEEIEKIFLKDQNAFNDNVLSNETESNIAGKDLKSVQNLFAQLQQDEITEARKELGEILNSSKKGLYNSAITSVASLFLAISSFMIADASSFFNFLNVVGAFSLIVTLISSLILAYRSVFFMFFKSPKIKALAEKLGLVFSPFGLIVLFTVLLFFGTGLFIFVPIFTILYLQAKLKIWDASKNPKTPNDFSNLDDKIDKL